VWDNLGKLFLQIIMNPLETFQRDIQKYCERLSTDRSGTLTELERTTFLKTLSPNMVSGHLQGNLLKMLTQIHRPKNVLEIGTFTGYAAIAIAQGLPEGSRLHTIEVNEELVYIIKEYFAKAKLEDKITFYQGNAAEIIPTLDMKFDMVFIDAGKRDNAKYYDLVFDRVNAGGLLITDNVLWGGKVIQNKYDKDTTLIHEFNLKVKNDPRVENVLLPIRDGLMVARKK